MQGSGNIEQDMRVAKVIVEMQAGMLDAIERLRNNLEQMGEHTNNMKTGSRCACQWCLTGQLKI